MRVGFIGLGTMGNPMARNVVNGGYDLIVYNRTASKTAPFRHMGVPTASSPADLARQSDALIFMVTGPTDLLDLLQRPQGILEGLNPGTVVINMSTVSLDATRRAAALVEAAGGRFLDAPVSGSKVPAEQATLVILVGGDPALIDQMEPLLLTMGKKVVRCGAVPAGTAMKLMINLLLGTMMVDLAEALVFGSRLGLDMEAMLETIASGAMAAPLFALKGKAIAQGDYTKHFPVDLVFKDLNLVLTEAGSLGCPLPATAACREAYNAARAMGWGDEDMAAVFKVLDRLAGR
ncbi:2-hydroxy-3-oxopropionate reductase [Desulfacinum hydrothermale DSM 13146]|uniref:2-hydroxy-3-oxopropionate reductase n=2 Tax=Desulfacinum hydrothermale TaxID=109258 RepID=A0A1W1XFQ1_9BACT|nr:2-hydroxy-3-oxopropionate reductase [Desulfacinum hydrothermale DSM 13146]